MNTNRSTQIPDSMIGAFHSLLRIAEGKGTEVDLARIALAINESATDFNGIVGVEDMRSGIYAFMKEIDALDFGEIREKKETELDELQRRIKQATGLEL